jgi:hypothetical protein
MLVRSVAARSRAPFAAMVVVALVLALAVPLAAAASPLANLDFTLLVSSQGTGSPLLLVAGQLPEGTQLPAELVLPVPEGSVVEWSGEIVGSNVEEDVPVEARIEQRDGATVVVFTLTQSLTGQAEVSYPNAVDPVDGWTSAAGYDLIAPVDVGAARMAIALPPGGQPASLPTGTLSAQGPQGYTYYYQEIQGVNAGDPLTYAIQFTLEPVQTTTDNAVQPATGEVPPLVIALIAAALGGAVLIVLASRSRSKGTDTLDEIEPAEVLDAESYEDAGGYENDADILSAEVATAETDADILSAEVATAETPTPPSTSWLTPQRLLIIAGVLVVGIVAAVILGGQQGQVGVTESADGWITQRISTASGDSALELSVQIACECPPEEEAPKMFEVLRQVPGVAYAALQGSTLLMRIEYDPALTNEAAIALALRGAGYLP